MNMISTGSFLTEMDATEKQQTIAEKFARVWEMKNAKAARAGGVSLMALSLAACGSSSTTSDSSGGTSGGTSGSTDEVTPISQSLNTTVDDVTGTTGDDTIRAVVDADTAGNDTLNTADVIALGAGSDTLDITFEVAATTAMPSATITGVENFVLTNVSGNALTASFAAIAGEESITNDMSTSDVTLTNLASGTSVTVNGNGAVTNANTAAGWVADTTAATINITGGVTAGTITVTGADLLTETYTSSGAANVTGAITSAATTTDVVINASSNLQATITGTAVDTLTISGAGNVDLNGGTLDATIETVAAGASTGDVDIILGNVAGVADVAGVDVADVTVTTGAGDDDVDMSNVLTAMEMTVSTGAGDDTITIGSALVDAAADGSRVADSIDGGAGTDILSMTSAIANGHAAITSISGIEEITISNTLAHSFTTANFQAGITTVNLAGGTGTLTLDAGANTVNLTDQLAGGALGLTDTGTATTDSVTVVNEDAAADAFNGQAITSTGFETVNIVTTGTGAATAQSVGAIAITADTGGTGTVNISGTNRIDLDGDITADVLNLSGLTAQAAGTATADMTGQNLIATAGGTATITGSAGDDVLIGDADDTTNIDGGAGDDNITGGTDAETIGGGAGDDTIDGGGGADTITGGAGDDQITLNGTTSSIDAGDGDDTVIAAGNLAFGASVIGGAGTDILSVNAAVTAPNGSVASGFETLVLATHAGITVDIGNFGNNTFSTVRVDDATNATVVQSIAGQNVQTGVVLGGTLTVTLEDATGNEDEQTITVSADASVTQTSDIIVADVEVINLVSDDSDNDAGANQHTILIDADTAHTINVSGDAGVIFTGSGDVADVTTMNAAGVVLDAVTDNGITYAASYNTVGGNTVVTGSNGVDSLTGGANTNDVISAGTGADTIVYTGGSDTFTGGAGIDTFDIQATGATGAYVTIADAAADDIIDLSDAAVTNSANIAAGNHDFNAAAWNALEVTLGAAATLDNYLDSASNGADGSTEGQIEWFEFGGNSYIVVSNDNTDNYTSATDSVIIISGTGILDDATMDDGVLTIA